MKKVLAVVLAIGAVNCLRSADYATAEVTRLRIVADRPTKIQIAIHPRDKVAAAYGIPIAHFKALELVESGGKLDAKRTEPHLVKRWAREAGRGWTAKQLATSYGPMQVLGIHYKELGYSPRDLDNVELNYELAGWYLSKCREKSKNWAGAYLKWNGGGNKKYPVKIARALVKVRKLKG